MAEPAGAAGDPRRPGSRGALRRGAPWLVAAATVAAFAGAFAGSFQFDDWNVIVRDPRVQSLAAWWRSMPGIRPVLKLTYAANHASGLGLAGFHAVNVAVHAAAAALALILLRRLEARAAAPAGAPADGASPGIATPAAGPGPAVSTRPGVAPGHAPAVAALLFALHPAQTEAVTYVSGRSASLAGALVLASALAHVAGQDGWRPRVAAWLSPALFALALGVREQAAALPFALLAVAGADGRRPFSLRLALRATASHWLVLAGAAAAAAASPVYRRMAAQSLGLRGPLENLWTHLGALAWLGGQVVRPDRLDADPLIPIRSGPDALALLAAAALAALVAAGAALLRRRPAEGLALLWTAAWLPHTSLLLPRPEPANDRQLYLALLGPAWLLGRALTAPGPGRRVRSGIAVALVAALAAGTAARNRVFAGEETFWRAAVEISPGNPRAWNNLGVALAAACRRDEAEAALRRSAELDVGGFRAAVNLRLLRAGEPLEEGAPSCPPPETSGEGR